MVTETLWKVAAWLKSSRLTAPFVPKARRTLEWLGHTVRLRQSPQTLERDARQFWQHYWVGPGNARFGNDGHWRGFGPFADDERWLDIGRGTSTRYLEMISAIGFSHHVERIVDWGVGGGANAVHFGRLCDTLIGVDVAATSLDESARQMKAEGLHNFQPVLIDVEEPEKATGIIKTCDVFLCLYVYEVFPTPEYGQRVLRIAFELLRPGGVAFLQIKYETGSWRTKARGYGYAINMVNMTSYRLEEFWRVASECGFEPELIKLVPWEAVVDDERYAYYLLRKPDRNADAAKQRPSEVLSAVDP